MNQNRRDFLKGTAWMGVAAAAAGCISEKNTLGFGDGGSMHGFHVAPMKLIRVGVIGVGARGIGAVQRISQIPGCRVTAISDINAAMLDRAQKWLKENGKPAAREWSRNGDEDAWKGLCDSDIVDVVYSVTPRSLHCPINVYAMAHGKHVLQEVPGAFSLDECWETVEAAEKYRRHCMMLENCTYGEAEMLAFNLIHKGKLGEIIQAEVEYTHDQRVLQYNPKDGRFWRLKRHMEQHGNYYPTHGLVPAGRCLDINRGDRLDQIVSMETKSASFEAYARATFSRNDSVVGIDGKRFNRYEQKMTKGDINMSMIHTANGRVITLKHNVCTPMPYNRGNTYLGTHGVFTGISLDFWKPADAYQMGSPCRFAWESKPGEYLHVYFDFEKAKRLSEEYKHPFWKVAGEMAKKVGGHGGMDFVMDLRWAYCLQNGLPLDTDVYDLATYSSIVELSERSVNAGSKTLDFPDYTRGGWKTAKAFTVDEIDINKFDFGKGVIHAKDAQTT
ncbi:MAG: Gfo/Idh/MocA family oxidoreductase [Kiritimatiellae bacterium]|nr:Gfo/Idh/MocA family oxidoreductase [Kiritimatiellia bacterium]